MLDSGVNGPSHFTTMMQMVERRESASELRRTRRFLLESAPAVALVVGLGVVGEARLFGSDGPARVPWALANLVPAVWFLVTTVRAARRADELQRLAYLRASAIGFAVSLLGTYAAVVLASVGVGDLRETVSAGGTAALVVWVAALVALTRRTR